MTILGFFMALNFDIDNQMITKFKAMVIFILALIAS